MNVHAQSLFALAVLCALLGLPETEAKAVFQKRDGDVRDLRAELKKVLGQLEEKLKTRGLNAQKRIPGEFGGEDFGGEDFGGEDFGDGDFDPEDPNFDGEFGKQSQSEASSMASSVGFMDGDGFGDNGPSENAPSDPSTPVGSGPSSANQGPTEGGPGPIGDEQKPMGDEQGPMGDEQGPMGDEQGSMGDEPVDDEQEPISDGQGSVGEEDGPPQEGDSMPSADDTNTPVENAPSVDEDETDIPDEAQVQTPVDKDTPPPVEDTEHQEDEETEEASAIPTFDIPEGVAAAIADLTEKIRAHVLAMADEADTKEGLQQLIDEKVKKVEDAWKFYDRVLNKVIENVLGVNNEMITALFEDKK